MEVLNKLDDITIVDGMEVTYACVSENYKKLRDWVDSDLANYIVCTTTLPVCHTLLIMVAIEICRGNIKAPWEK